LEYALKKYQSTGGSVDAETWVAYPCSYCILKYCFTFLYRLDKLETASMICDDNVRQLVNYTVNPENVQSDR
jgi:hypothetical protein